jgi:hypothetical protein
MTKEDLSWVVIRATGLLLILRAAFYIPEVLSAGVALWYLGEPMGSEGARMAIDGQRNLLVSGALYFLINAALGLYFLRRGIWIYRLLSLGRPERSNNTVETDARKNGARGSL